MLLHVTSCLSAFLKFGIACSLCTTVSGNLKSHDVVYVLFSTHWPHRSAVNDDSCQIDLACICFYDFFYRHSPVWMQICKATITTHTCHACHHLSAYIDMRREHTYKQANACIHTSTYTLHGVQSSINTWKLLIFVCDSRVLFWPIVLHCCARAFRISFVSLI